MNKLDASTLTSGRTHNWVTIQTSEWENLSSGVRPPSGGDSSSGVGFAVASEWGLIHQQSCELGKDLKLGCDPSTYWIHRLRAGVGPIVK